MDSSASLNISSISLDFLCQTPSPLTVTMSSPGCTAPVLAAGEPAATLRTRDPSLRPSSCMPQLSPSASRLSDTVRRLRTFISNVSPLMNCALIFLVLLFLNKDCTSSSSQPRTLSIFLLTFTAKRISCGFRVGASLIVLVESWPLSPGCARMPGRPGCLYSRMPPVGTAIFFLSFDLVFSTILDSQAHTVTSFLDSGTSWAMFVIFCL
mmetsp:Transcript_9942/g.25490  ORF Transcript_9942/g.25490 Transcript_9942/m.25490 type:complete len:209 (-) Transcript_9942:1869-2495(-)